MIIFTKTKKYQVRCVVDETTNTYDLKIVIKEKKNGCSLVGWVGST